MKIVKPSTKLLWMTSSPLTTIERAGRIAYKSEERITDISSIPFIKMLLKNGHESVLEHASMSYQVICDRGVSHEIVRHRLFSYTQESTRYCNYGSEDIQFIMPPYGTPDTFTRDSIEDQITEVLKHCEDIYKYLISIGEKPQIARAVLPTCLKTEIAVTGNFREWRHFFKLRTSKNAHPQMQEVANLILKDAIQHVSVVFDEFVEDPYENH